MDGPKELTQEMSDSSYAKCGAAKPIENTQIKNDNGQPSVEYLELCSSHYDKILEDIAASQKSDHTYLMPTEIQEPAKPPADYNLSNSQYEKPVRIVRPLGLKKPGPQIENFGYGCGYPSISSQNLTAPEILQLPTNSTPQSKRSKRPLVVSCVILTVVIIFTAIVTLTVLYINEKDKSDASAKENNLLGTNLPTSTTKRGTTTQTTANTTLETSLASTSLGSLTKTETIPSTTTTPPGTTTAPITTTTAPITTTTTPITTTTTPSKTTTTPSKTTTTVQTPNVSTSDLYKDCKELKLQGYTTSGVYSIYPYLPETTAVGVYCDMTTEGGGWTVFQHRKDGSVNFYVNWVNYKSGFGDPAGEYWLGNDHLHRLTSLGTSELYVRLEKFSGGWFHAKYNEFTVAAETDGYRMRLKVGSYQGNAGDSIESHGTTNTNGFRFSTRDVDNDFAPGSCTVARKGAWWHNICTWANLNGDYGNGGCVSSANCNFWYSLTNSYSGVKTSFMMVRRG